MIIVVLYAVRLSYGEEIQIKKGEFLVSYVPGFHFGFQNKDMPYYYDNIINIRYGVLDRFEIFTGWESYNIFSDLSNHYFRAGGKVYFIKGEYFGINVALDTMILTESHVPYTVKGEVYYKRKLF